MKTPAFWQSRNLISDLLLPFSLFYAVASNLRRLFIRQMHFAVPVICVGNATAGGAGKTPVALYIGAKLQKKKLNAFFLSRGYGGKLRGPVLVNPDQHSARDVGDEPLLLARVLPTVIAHDRAQGARFAMANGAQAIIMDDGFQNPSVVKTLSLLVVDGSFGFGNGRLLPAGPLRETITAAATRARALIVINRGNIKLPAKPALFAHTKPDVTLPPGKTFLAFCGLAHPQKFFATLTEAGATVVDTVAFTDHHFYSAADIAMLTAKAAAANATLVTTPKDAVRLPSEFRAQVTVVDVSLIFDNEAMLDSLLAEALHANN